MLKAFCRFGLFLRLVCVSSLSLAGGASHYEAYTSMHDFQPMGGLRIQALAPFNTLIVSSNIDLILVKSSQNTIEFLNSPGKAPLRLTQEGNTLSISNPNFISKIRPQVQLSIPYLNQLTTQGSARVQGHFANNQWLIINSSGSSQVSLTGSLVNLQQVTASDTSRVKLYWVDSPNLVIKGSDFSLIKLAGVTQVLHASLEDRAQLQAQYLRPGQAMIQTHDHAFAGIAATKALRAFVSEDSNIFYYKYPRHFTEYDQQSGNALQVDWRP